METIKITCKETIQIDVDYQFNEIQYLTLAFQTKIEKDAVIYHLNKYLDVEIEDLNDDTTIIIRPTKNNPLFLKIKIKKYRLNFCSKLCFSYYPILTNKDRAPIHLVGGIPRPYYKNKNKASIYLPEEIPPSYYEINIQPRRIVDGVWGNGKRLEEAKNEDLVELACRTGTSITCSKENTELLRLAETHGVKVIISDQKEDLL